MAILMAFQTPEVDVIGLTTIFGNVLTEDATRNALLLVYAYFFCLALFSFFLIAPMIQIHR